MQIPPILLDQVRAGQVVLFLGAGASLGALHKDNKRPPIGQQLADILADKFLDEEFRGRPLAQISELAISETDLTTVQEFIADIFQDFYPNTFHRLIPRIPWKAIATTNYDLIVERAYSKVSDHVQQAVVFKKNGEHIEHKLRSITDIPYIKLHGCITDIHDDHVPLILTHDQYVTHRKYRSRLFERLQILAHEYPILFVGYSVADSDIRAILLELSELGDAQPRSYLLSPSLTSAERRLWGTRKLECLVCTFKEFLEEVDARLGSVRGLNVMLPKDNHPIQQRFAVSSSIQPSESLLTMLNRDADYLHQAFPTDKTNPKLFYQGYLKNWDAIDMGLDVHRRLTDDILSEVFLTTEEERGVKQELIVIKGHAGSGKTVLARRIAWEAARTWRKLCLWTKAGASLDYELLVELHALCKERIFLFVDPATDYQEMIASFLKNAQRDKLPLTIISAERHNEWNSFCESLNPYVTNIYEVKYLIKREIEDLVRLLAEHKSLGHMEGMEFADQVEELESRAGRQLLVALHEATMGRPFSDIVFDEYKSIASPQAQTLYLTVCILHRLGVVTRAGVIARIHNIPFSMFKERLFKPLEFVVFASHNSRVGDFEYRTRHQHIANEVFERVLVNPQDRFDEYVRILGAIDVDYNSDRDAFVRMTNAKELKSLFTDPEMIRQIYDVAVDRSREDPMLMQQRAIFEMGLGDTGVPRAHELLQEAHRLAPWQLSIDHSLAELALRKSELASSDIERHKYREETRTISKRLIAKNTLTAHPHHTLLKVGLLELEEVLQAKDSATSDRKIRELEMVVAGALQAFPDDQFILEADARFNTLINNHPEALTSLQQAFSKNKRSPYIAQRLANAYKARGDMASAIQILRECLDHNPNEKEISYRLAKILMPLPEANKPEIKHLLRNSFTKGDARHGPQFWYARHLYLEGNINEAQEMFAILREANVDAATKREPRGKVEENGVLVRFSGILTKKELSYAFIKRDGLNDSIYANREDNTRSWHDISTHRRVSFELWFNYRGPIARNIMPES